MGPTLFLIIILPLAISAVFGAGLLAKGMGTPRFSEPRCAKCRYDLRGSFPNAPSNCPECGAELSQPHAVSWGKNVREPRKIRAGAAMLILPLLIIGAMLVAQTRHGILGSRSAASNATLISALATKADSPWEWQELQRRYAAGSLDNQGAAQAIDQLVVFLNKKPNAANNGPLHWAEPFIAAANTGGAMSPDQHKRLAQAYYGSTPSVVTNPRISAGKSLHFKLSLGGHWDLPGDDLVYALKAVKLADGRTLTAVSENDYNARRGKASPDGDLLSDDGTWSMEGDVVLKELPPGEHTLTFVTDVGVVGKGSVRKTSNQRPGQATNWPAGGLRWSADTPVKVTVVGTAAEAIPMETNPSLDPSGGLRFAVKAIRSESRKGGTNVSVELLESGRPPVPISADLVLRIAGSEYDAGSMVLTPNSSRMSRMSVDIGSPLPPDVTTLDILLRPNATHAEATSGIDKIWGKPIEQLGVPLKRLDVAPAPPPIE